jgi:hypothetical protein
MMVRIINTSQTYRLCIISSPIVEAVMVQGLLCILKGPAMSTVATNGPFTFLGSRHESEQVPPQPYSKLKLRS